MRATITRDMKVMNDKGEVAHFTKSTHNNPFVEISPAIYGRLYRAGAACPFQPQVELENGKPIEQAKQKTRGAKKS